MSSVVSSQLPLHPAIEKIRRFRFLYAIAVNAIAIVIVVAFVMSLKVREYRTIGHVDVTPLTKAAITAESANATISRSIRETASDKSLLQLLRHISETKSQPEEDATGNSPTMRQWSTAELDGLRQRMAFAVTPDGVNGSLRVTVALSGKGRKQESQLVELFLAAVSDNIATQATDQTNAHLEILASSQLEALKRRRDETLIRANQQLHQVNDRIVGLAGDVMDLAKTVPATTPERTNEKSGSVETNPYLQASFGPTNGGNVDVSNQWRERFTAIPVSDLSKTFVEIEKGWNETMRPLDEFVNRPALRTQAPTLRALSRSNTVQVPFGLSAPREWLLLTIAAAMAIGCVLASGIDVNSHDPGLGTTEEIEKSLGVPVLGHIRADGGSQNNVQKHWSMRILKLNELVVFTTLLAVLIMAGTNSEIRETLMQNPLHAVARILWNLRSVG